MIDFENKKIFKLSPAKDREVNKHITPIIEPILADGEKIIRVFSSIRDFVVFTDKRIISVNTQGITGAKKDFTSMPYSRIQVYSVETAGTLDIESELQLYFSSIGMITFEFSRGSDIREIARIISNAVL
ncbi:MAG: PH domain-containing protein [Lachnospiraceae bacterium]|nr:PH domain-containing protein [Lachnospiraceae bacterium]